MFIVLPERTVDTGEADFGLDAAAASFVLACREVSFVYGMRCICS
jgi:hypothetical protein